MSTCRQIEAFILPAFHSADHLPYLLPSRASLAAARSASCPTRDRSRPAASPTSATASRCGCSTQTLRSQTTPMAQRRLRVAKRNGATGSAVEFLAKAREVNLTLHAARRPVDGNQNTRGPYYLIGETKLLETRLLRQRDRMS